MIGQQREPPSASDPCPSDTPLDGLAQFRLVKRGHRGHQLVDGRWRQELAARADVEATSRQFVFDDVLQPFGAGIAPQCGDVQ